MVAVARSVFEVVSRAEFLATVRARGHYLEERLAPLCAEHGITLRGRGLLWALVLREPTAEAIVARAFADGLLINAPRPNLLRLMPSLRVSEAEVDELVRLLERALV
jgi:acetylornithine/N-succinyldiaminopimelate aminotransferase